MRLSHVTIQTSSFAEEIDFYATYTGLAIQRDMRPMGANIVFLANAQDDTQIEVIDNPDAADSGNANLSIGFVSKDLDALHDALAADGFRPTDYVSPMRRSASSSLRTPPASTSSSCEVRIENGSASRRPSVPFVRVGSHKRPISRSHRRMIRPERRMGRSAWKRR